MLQSSLSYLVWEGLPFYRCAILKFEDVLHLEFLAVDFTMYDYPEDVSEVTPCSTGHFRLKL